MPPPFFIVQSYSMARLPDCSVEKARMEPQPGFHVDTLARLEKVIVDFMGENGESVTAQKLVVTKRKGSYLFHNWQFAYEKCTRSEMSSLRIAYLASVAHSNILEGKLLTKRDIYYMARNLFPSPATVDRALHALSVSVNVARNDLNIVAAAKGLVAGNIAFVDEDGYSVNVAMFGAGGCLVPCRPERMREIKSDACAIVVLEKETSFHSLLHEPKAQQLLHTCIFVTGKGYPDLASKMFLSAVSRVQREKGLPMPIFILTDADPHGIHIAFCYIRNLLNCNVQWIGVRPSDNGSLIQIRESALLPVTSAEITLADGMLRQIACCETKDAESFAPLVAELNLLKATGKKFEIEALTCTGLGEDMSGLLRYLLSRT